MRKQPIFSSPSEYTALLLAAEDGHVDVVTQLLEHGASADLPNAVLVNVYHSAHPRLH